MIPLSKPSLDERELEAVKRVMEDGCVAGTCPEVEKFEKELAAFVGSKYAVATSSATAALHLACMAMNVNRYSRVVCPSYTFPATANAPLYCGCNDVRIMDVNGETFNIDENISLAIFRNPDVIIPVHCFGNPCDMKMIKDYADSKRASIIEDAACSIPAYSNSKHAGVIGDAGVYSFYGIKN